MSLVRFRVRAPYLENPAYGWVFRFLEYGLSIELRSIIRPKVLTLRASAKALFKPAQAPVVRVRAPYLEEPAYGGFFVFWDTDSPSNYVRLFGLKASSCGPALKRCSTRRRRPLSESGHHIQNNPPMAGFSFSGIRTLHRTTFDDAAKGPLGRRQSAARGRSAAALRRSTYIAGHQQRPKLEDWLNG